MSKKISDIQKKHEQKHMDISVFSLLWKFNPKSDGNVIPSTKIALGWYLAAQVLCDVSFQLPQLCEGILQILLDICKGENENF